MRTLLLLHQNEALSALLLLPRTRLNKLRRLILSIRLYIRFQSNKGLNQRRNIEL